MKNTSLLISTAMAGLLALSTSAIAADNKDSEKCMGVVKAGKNDCETSKHSCAGEAKTDGDKEEWVYVPKGTCEKIVGGVVKKK